MDFEKSINSYEMKKWICNLFIYRAINFVWQFVNKFSALLLCKIFFWHRWIFQIFIVSRSTKILIVSDHIWPVHSEPKVIFYQNFSTSRYKIWKNWTSSSRANSVLTFSIVHLSFLNNNLIPLTLHRFIKNFLSRIITRDGLHFNYGVFILQINNTKKLSTNSCNK